MAKSKRPQRGLKNCILKHGSPYSVIIFDRELVMEFYLGKWVVSYVEDIGNLMGNAHIVGGEPRGEAYRRRSPTLSVCMGSGGG